MFLPVSFKKFELFGRNVICKTIKRYAGHSKWQNIKHIKKEMDGKKSNLTQQIIQKMARAVRENNNADPYVNVELARAIAEGKKKSIPSATIENALKKLQDSYKKVRPILSISKGPSESLIILLLMNDQVLPRTNFILRRAGFSLCEEPNREVIMKLRSIITTIRSNYEDETIINDAIRVGADDAEIIQKDNKEFVQFICSPFEILSVERELVKLNYEINESKMEYNPLELITLEDNDLHIYKTAFDQMHKSNLAIKLTSNVA